MSEKNVILYSSKNCPRCKALKQWLRRNKIPFVTKSLDDTDVLTELVMRDIAVFSAPILETKDRFFLAHEIFDQNNRLTSIFKESMRGDSPK